MLELLNQPQHFDELAEHFRPFFTSMSRSFSRDANVRKIEDAEGLYNIALSKLFEACTKFQFNKDISYEQNEKMFRSMVHLYARNACIDVQYLSNLPCRKPRTQVVSIDCPISSSSIDCEVFIDIKDMADSHVDRIALREVRDLIRLSLNDEQREIFDRYLNGDKMIQIAGDLGLSTAQVRQVITKKIAKVATKYVDFD